MHLNCSKEVGYQQNVVTARTARHWAGNWEPLAPSAQEACERFGCSLRQGIEHPETSWTAFAGPWLEFCIDLGKNARYRTKTNLLPSRCGDEPFAVLEQMAKQVM